MRTITYHKSTSGSTTLNHIIYNDDNVSVKSLASLVLLNDSLREMDVDYLNLQFELQEYLNKRYLFLINEKRKCGDLTCHYCNRTNLEIGYRYAKYAYLNNSNKNLATIDHIVPRSSGFNPLDESNWVVSCKRCNTKKGSMSYKEYMEKIKNK